MKKFLITTLLIAIFGLSLSLGFIIKYILEDIQNGNQNNFPIILFNLFMFWVFYFISKFISSKL